MTAIASIQARMGSTRLPGKVLLEIEESRIVEHVVERCRTSETVDTVYLTVGDRPENDALVEYARRAGVDCVRGPEEDLLARHAASAHEADAETVVRITGDCPFVPPEEIDRVIGEHEQNDAVLTTNNTDAMPTGTAVDVLDSDVLDALSSEGATHPVAPLRADESVRPVEVTDARRWTEVGSAHTAVDTPMDYWNVVDAVRAVGTDPYDVTEWLADR